jgi:hypothetical protein
MHLERLLSEQRAVLVLELLACIGSKVKLVRYSDVLM